MTEACDIENKSTSSRLGGVRRVIADRMMKSLANSAQLTFHADAEVTRLLAARTEWKAQGRIASIEDCVIYSFVAALSDSYEMNGAIDGDVVTTGPEVNMAVALAVDGALMTPVIVQANKLDLWGLANERARLVAQARANQLKVSQMKGGTATVSNLGMSAVRHFTPILNAGQLTLLGIGAVSTNLGRAQDGTIIDVNRIGLSLTVDHRVIDGEPAAQLLSSICLHLGRLHEQY